MEKTQNPIQVFSIEAGANLATTKRFVKISSGKAVYCTANAKALGVLQEPVDSGFQASIGTSGIYLVEVGAGGVTENTEVTSDATGKAIAVAALAVASTIATGAVAMKGDAENATVTSAVSGGLLPVKINGYCLDTVAEGGFARIKVA